MAEKITFNKSNWTGKEGTILAFKNGFRIKDFDPEFSR